MFCRLVCAFMLTFALGSSPVFAERPAYDLSGVDLSDFRDLSIQECWRRFALSMPTAHQEDDFRYIVFGISSSILERIRPLFEADDFSDLSLRVLSLSLVDAEHPQSITPQGLILEVPPENIVATAQGDMASGGSDDKFRQLSHLNYRWGLQSPTTLLQNTYFYGYNEIIALGTSPQTKRSIRILGAYRVDSQVYLEFQPHADVRDVLQRWSTRFQQPYVLLRGNARYEKLLHRLKLDRGFF